MVTKVKADINLDDVHPDVHPQLCVIMGIKEDGALVDASSVWLTQCTILSSPKESFCWISLKIFIWHLGEFFFKQNKK
jgi:hypothetical protein